VKGVEDACGEGQGQRRRARRRNGRRGRRFQAAGPGQECGCSVLLRLRTVSRRLNRRVFVRTSVPHAFSLSRHSKDTARVHRAVSYASPPRPSRYPDRVFHRPGVFETKYV
jgi:hypothetical protein